MDSSIVSKFETQIGYLQQALTISNGLKERCVQLEIEKNESLKHCAELETKIDRLSKEKCSNCSVLINILKKERKERELFKKEEKAKLLKTIAKTLESLDDRNTNQLTNAHQLFTELVCGGLDDYPKKKEKRNITLVEDEDIDEEIINSKVLANESVLVMESEESSNDCSLSVVPETELVTDIQSGCSKQAKPKSLKLQSRNMENGYSFKENKMSSKQEVEIDPVIKKRKGSPVLLKTNISCRQSPLRTFKVNIDETLVNNLTARSPSVLSDVNELLNSPKNLRPGEPNDMQEDKVTMWKMKPSFVIESNIGAASGKKLKQMTLNLTRAEKKHDISLSEGFKGGLASNNMKNIEEEKDLVLASPEHLTKKNFCKKNETCETIDDPDLTIFNPAITSTCVPLESSFDRLPQVQKSPSYKYRRDTVRKKEERMKLPGQDCDQCARYYEAAGLVKTEEIRTRMNACSRHRDKYQIRAHTPPGFWDPVLPKTPTEMDESGL